VFILKLLKYLVIAGVVIFLLLTVYGIYKGMKEINQRGFFSQYNDYLKTVQTLVSTESSTKRELTRKGFHYHENKWYEFNFSTIEGETPAIIWDGLKEMNAILKYGFSCLYPFDGKVGFIGGNDIREQWNKCREERKSSSKTMGYDIYCDDKNATVYLFRTVDGGKTFTKHHLKVHGKVTKITKFNEEYFVMIEPHLGEAKTFISKDKGESWTLFKPFSIELFFSRQRFIFSRPKEIGGRKYYDYFYTKDGGETSKILPNKIVGYAKSSMYQYPKKLFYLDIGKLVFTVKDELVLVDIDTLNEKRKILNIPKGKQLARYDGSTGYFNIKTKETYFLIENFGTHHKRKTQKSIYFPKENKIVSLPSKLDKVVKFKVDGDYIGGLTRQNGLLVHIWTYDKGDRWNFEVLPHYFWNEFYDGMSQNNQVWFPALVKNKKGVKNDSYFIIGVLSNRPNGFLE